LYMTPWDENGLNY